jgi:Flp pilus assembly protein TadD
MRRRIYTGVLIVFAICIAFDGQATTVPEIVAKAKPAVVQVIALDANLSPMRTGTGFFVSADGDLLTNFHVIQGATHISARTDKGAIFVFEKTIAGSADSDVALLKFQATDVDFLKLGSSASAVEGQTVLVIGNPEGLQGTVSNGIISAFRENRSYIQITAPISPGSSGSPVLDETGQVIGMASLVAKEGENLNFAISAEVINAVTRSHSLKITPPPNNTTIPTSAENLYLNQANLAWQEAKYELQIAYLSEAIRVNPNDAEVYYERGEAYRGQSQYREAIADFDEYFRLATSDTGWLAHRYRGLAYLALGQYEKAAADFNEACRITLDHESVVQYNPIDDYTDFIQGHPNEAPPYFSRAAAYFELKQYRKAVDDYSEAIRLDSKYVDAYKSRGKAYQAIGDLTRANADFKTAQQLESGKN